MVRSLAAYGIKHEGIAHMVGLRSAKTLRKHFRKEIDSGAIEATAQVVQTLYDMATSGKHPAATIYWLNTRARWQEGPSLETRPAAIPDFIVAREREKEAA